jgi:hypothetical protein
MHGLSSIYTEGNTEGATEGGAETSGASEAGGVSDKSSELPEGPAGLRVLSYAEDRIAGGALQIHRSSDSRLASRRSISELNTPLIWHGTRAAL